MATSLTSRAGTAPASTNARADLAPSAASTGWPLRSSSLVPSRRSGASSSTSRIGAPGADAASGGSAASTFDGAAAIWRGRWMRKIVPSPIRLSTVIWPPDCATIPCTVAKPSPVPPFSRRVVKKGSKSRGKTSGGCRRRYRQLPTPPSGRAAGCPPRPAAAPPGARWRCAACRPAAWHRGHLPPGSGLSDQAASGPPSPNAPVSPTPGPAAPPRRAAGAAAA